MDTNNTDIIDNTNLEGDINHEENEMQNTEVSEFNVEKNITHWIQVTTLCVIKILISLIAMVLAWNCNAKENLLFRVVLTLISGFFGEFYILYYAIYRTFLGNKCYI